MTAVVASSKVTVGAVDVHLRVSFARKDDTLPNNLASVRIWKFGLGGALTYRRDLSRGPDATDRCGSLLLSILFSVTLHVR